MFTAPTSTRLFAAAPTSPWSLQSMPGFPYMTYTGQQEKYVTYEEWYEGVALENETIITNGSKKVEKYPIRINPIRGTAKKHVSVLFGTNVDSVNFGGVPVRFIPDIQQKSKADPSESGTSVSADDAQAIRITNALTEVFSENGGGSIFYQNGFLSQYMGGSVLVAKWRPDLMKIEITNPNPKEFICIPEGRDYWNLREAWIIQTLNQDEILAYNFGAAVPPGITPGNYFYVEHWKRDFYTVQINGIDVLDNDGLPYGGVNPFGVVPIVYIPHMRTGTQFLGESMISSSVQGIIREMNGAWADVSDAINDDSHSLVAMRNSRGTPKTIRVDSRTVVDLGSQAGLGVGEGNPDLFAVKIASTSQPMLDYGFQLDKLYRREVDHPSVADGEDEGSQRSSLTLNSRMYPLESHCEMERVFWTVGLNQFAKILLKMMAMKGLYGVKLQDTEVPLIIQWHPMFPKDRAEIVNEIAIRNSTKTASRKHLMSMAGDIRDPEAMEEEILEEDARVSEQKIRDTEATLALSKKYAPDPSPASGSPAKNQSKA